MAEEKIAIQELRPMPRAEFRVTVGEDGATAHKVVVPQEYYDNLTRGKISVEDFVRNSFEFLLAREPKESILRQFELPLIREYFPEYESEMIKTVDGPEKMRNGAGK